MAESRKKFLYVIGTKGAKKAKKDLGGVDKSMKRMRVSTAGLQRSVGVLRNKLLLLTFATAGIISIVRTVTKNFIEQENAVTKLEAVLKSTGGVALLTSKGLQAMAAGLQKVTSFGDETIITAQSLLLTFTQIGSDVFPQAIEAILNVSTAMGTDLQSSVLQLGKALNDPVLGIAALTRVGIQLSRTQKEQIKLFVAEGKTAEAQKIILGELETQFGDLARAMRENTEGEIKQMTMAFGDMTEVIGEGLSPAIISISKTLTSLFENLNFIMRSAFGNLTEVELIQQKIAKLEAKGGSELGLIFQSLLGKPQKVKDEIANLRAEIEGLLAVEAAEEGLIILTAWANDIDEVKTAYAEMLEEVEPLFGNFDDTIRVLDTSQQLLIDNVEELTDGLIQATLFGQKFGDAIVSSLKAIAAELIKQAAVFLLMNLFTGGTASLTGARGFFNFAATGNFIPPAPSINSGGGNQGPAVINQNTFLIINDEQATELQSILNRAQFNA